MAGWQADKVVILRYCIRNWIREMVSRDARRGGIWDLRKGEMEKKRRREKRKREKKGFKRGAKREEEG